MKLTIDIPAPTHQLELISRLRQKIRNYKTSMKQLQRAHYITKDLLRRAEERNDNAVMTARYEALEAAYHDLLDENKALRKRVEDAERDYDSMKMPIMDAAFTDTRSTYVNGGGASRISHKEGNGQA